MDLFERLGELAVNIFVFTVFLIAVISNESFSKENSHMLSCHITDMHSLLSHLDLDFFTEFYIISD